MNNLNKFSPSDIVEIYTVNAPVDLLAMAKAMGLEVRFDKGLSSDISGKIECEPFGPCKITVNSNHPRTRQSEPLAHEIAHYVMHRHLIGDGLIDDGMYRSKLSRNGAGKVDIFEREANLYAAEMLMPAALVKNVYYNGQTSPADIAKIFDVSPAVAEVRLRELKLR